MHRQERPGSSQRTTAYRADSHQTGIPVIGNGDTERHMRLHTILNNLCHRPETAGAMTVATISSKARSSTVIGDPVLGSNA